MNPVYNTNISPEFNLRTRIKKDRYIQVKHKFYVSHLIASTWMCVSIFLSIPWVNDLGVFITTPIAVIVIAGISYIPGYMNAFMVSSLLFDRQPKFRELNPLSPVTILIACWNEEKGIRETLRYIADQDYQGKIDVIVVDNNSTDQTAKIAKLTEAQFNLDITVVHESAPGKNHALNAGLPHVKTDLVITLDADTILHPSAVRYIVARMKSAPHDICAVAGAMLVRNSRSTFLTKIQEWDYFLGIASVKRLQGMFQGTLVAQGAFSLYKTEAIRAIGGWPDAIGEDIVLTWKFLSNDWKVYFEPLAVAFTDVPESFHHFFRQRSRWARGMIEGLRLIKPWEHPISYVRYLTGCNLVMPYLDLVYTFCWLPGLCLAFFGYYWIVGPTTLFVLPLTMLQSYILYRHQKNVFSALNLRVRKNKLGFLAYVLLYQMMMSPISVIGYMQEAFRLRRVWK